MVEEGVEAKASNEGIVDSSAQTDSESACNNNGAHKTAVVAGSSSGAEKSLELADELMASGSKALKEDDYAEAVECFSRALEIRVASHGELSPECVQAYYKYGCALLYKAQEEADPLGVVPKKESESKQDSANNGSAENVANGDASASNKADVDGAAKNDSNGSDEEEGVNDSDADVDEEDESDLDLAWKMLDVARAITEKKPGDTMEKVDILSTLAEVSMEREDLETSLADYNKALSILERLVEPDSRHIAELNFRICLCLEIGVNPKEAIVYCQKAMSVCHARIERLKNEAEKGSSSSSSASDTDKQKEIETMMGLASDLEKKLEDLEQLASSTKLILAQLLGISAPESKQNEGSSSSVNVDSSRNIDSKTPTESSGQASGSSGGITHLGVVGRGVKRVVMNAVDPIPSKKPAFDSSEDKK